MFAAVSAWPGFHSSLASSRCRSTAAGGETCQPLTARARLRPGAGVAAQRSSASALETTGHQTAEGHPSLLLRSRWLPPEVEEEFRSAFQKLAKLLPGG